MLRELSSTPKTTASGESGDVDRGRGPADDGETIPTSASKKRTRRRKPSRYISKRQATNLMEALKFASLIGFPLNVSVDISWLFFSGSADDRTRFARCQQRLSKWTSRRGFPLTLMWTREVGKHGGINTHVLLHVPPWLMESGDFERALELAFEPEGGPNHAKATRIQPAPFPEGKLGYNLKGLDPKDAKELGVRASFQGDLEGKRVGCTENIFGAVLQIEIR